MRRSIFLLFFFLLAPAPSARAADPKLDPAAAEFFEKKVRPILVDQCAACHSGKKRRGNLQVDGRAALLKGGDTGPALVPGHPEKSLLIQAISYKEQLRMPPRSKLPDEQIAVLTSWVKMGAPWPGSDATGPAEEKIDFSKRLAHWSFQPVRDVPVPAVRDASWPRNPIDRFLLARLEAKNLRPVPDTDRRTLLRRVTYDLTGLPPTSDEIRDFVDDRSPAAFDKVVARLLASPAYGERWGRHWLDLVRFAETSGHEFDFEIPHAHAYRDYVIRAFNDDVPYDSLVQEHLAGDLLPSPRRLPDSRLNESILGTGFWFLGESKHSPVDLRGDGADRRDNMIDVFGKAFLGLTISCARCHDHKFDPITTREYYSLVSYLQSSRMQRAFLDPPERIAQPAASLAALRRKAAALAIRRTADTLDNNLATLTRESLSRARPDEPLLQSVRRLSDPATFAAAQRELAERLRRQNAARQTSQVFTDFTRTDLRDWYPSGVAFDSASPELRDVVFSDDDRIPVRRLLLGAASNRVSPRLQGALRSRTFPIAGKHMLYRARGKNVVVNLIIDGFQQIRDPIYGGLRFAIQSDQPRWFVQNLSMWVGLQAYIEILDDGNGEVEIEQILFSDHGTPPPEPLPAPLVQLAERARSADDFLGGFRSLLTDTVRTWREGKPLDSDRQAILQATLTSNVFAPSTPAAPPSPDTPWRKLLREVATLERALPDPVRALALADGNGVQDRVHIRGNPKTLGEEAPRVLPAVVAGDNQPVVATTSGRLEMAQRLTRPENPLFARIIVNRLWHHHFGQGIVRSTDDFGHQGDKPTHPELLDWLASELVRANWSLKHLHRLMLTTRAYQMTSRGDSLADSSDPRNELLHRMPIRRLEAEAIRDAMLAVSGRLDRAMFGRGPLPHLTEFMDGRGRPASGPLDGNGRRSVYLNVRRNFLSPLFLAFDYPTPFTAIGRRSVSNVPAQALSLLNNPFILQQAHLWAERETRSPANDRARIAAMYETAFGRLPSDREITDALQFLDEQSKEHGRRDARAWADLAHVLFNVKEFIFLN